MNFSEKILKLRNSQGLSLKQLADKLDTSKSVVWKYEQNDGFPSADVLKKLSLYFNVTVDYLLFDDEEKTDIIKSTDKRIAEYLEKVRKMEPEDKEYVFKTIDLIIERKKDN
jgi:transcriptional regulator with XRE-family HTH domain